LNYIYTYLLIEYFVIDMSWILHMCETKV